MSEGTARMHLAIDRSRVAFGAAALAVLVLVLVFDFFIMHGQKQGLQMYDHFMNSAALVVLD